MKNFDIARVWEQSRECLLLIKCLFSVSFKIAAMFGSYIFQFSSLLLQGKQIPSSFYYLTGQVDTFYTTGCYFSLFLSFYSNPALSINWIIDFCFYENMRFYIFCYKLYKFVKYYFYYFSKYYFYYFIIISLCKKNLVSPK